MNLDQFVRAFNDEFNEPFLPKGFVDAEVRKDGFVLRIGPRDVHFDKEGRVLGAGTAFGCWKIERSDELGIEGMG